MYGVFFQLLKVRVRVVKLIYYNFYAKCNAVVKRDADIIYNLVHENFTMHI